MLPAPTLDTPENWDGASQRYAALVAPVTQHFSEDIVSQLDADSTVEALEVGAGSGAPTQALAGR